MRALAILLYRELRSRWLLYPASLAMGAFVAILPLVAGRPSRPEELRGAGALGTALIWTVILSSGLGTTFLARDLGEGRLSYDFRLPIPSDIIWAARLAGAYVTVVLSGLLIFAIPALAGMDVEGAFAGLDVLASQPVSRHPSDPVWLAGVARFMPLLLVGLLLVGNLVGLAQAGLRAWTGVDLASLTLVGLSCSWAVVQFQRWVAFLPIQRLVPLCASVVLLGMLAASRRQVRQGVSELDAARRASSTTLAAASLVAAVGSLLFVFWYLHPTPRGLDPGHVSLRPLGNQLVAAIGVPRGRDIAFRFVIDPATSRWRRLGPAAGLDVHQESSWPRLSAGGSVLAWIDATGEVSFQGFARPFARARDLYLPDVAAEARFWQSRASDGFSTARALERRWPEPPAGWTISPDGRFLAYRTSAADGSTSRLVIEELVGGTLHASVELRECSDRGPIEYLSTQRIQTSCGKVWRMSDGPDMSDLREIDLATLTVLRSVGFPGAASSSWSRIHQISKGLRVASMRRASDSTRGGWEILRVDDPRSVRPIDPPLGAYPWGNPSDARFLDDQGLLLTLNGDQHGLVVVYEANGRARWVVQREENHLRISTLSERDGRSVAILGAEREVYEFRNGRSQLAPRYRRALMVDLLTGEVSVLPDDSLLERPASRGTEAVVELAEDGNWRWIHLRTGETRVLPIGPLAPTSAASSRSTGESASFLVPVES